MSESATQGGHKKVGYITSNALTVQ